MPKYVVLYTAPVSVNQQMENTDPAMGAEIMKAWNDWAARAGKGLVDLGTPLAPGRKVDSRGTSDAGTEVAGYSILSAGNSDAAMDLLNGHPHLQLPGAAIEVYETLDIPGG